jgi:hypothetical protein
MREAMSRYRGRSLPRFLRQMAYDYETVGNKTKARLCRNAAREVEYAYRARRHLLSLVKQNERIAKTNQDVANKAVQL